MESELELFAQPRERQQMQSRPLRSSCSSSKVNDVCLWPTIDEPNTPSSLQCSLRLVTAIKIMVLLGGYSSSHECGGTPSGQRWTDQCDPDVRADVRVLGKI